MKFVNPWILLTVIPVLLAGGIWYLTAEKRKARMLKQLLGPDAGNPAACSLSRRKRKWKFLLIMAAMVMLICAGARPYIHRIMLPAPDNSRDILVLFDVSRSMLASDLPPSRMEQAKFLLRQIMASFPQDRFGIVPFAGNAFLSCPLTTDHHALLTIVNDLDPASVPVGGTDLSKAMTIAIRAFDGSGGDHRAILLLTDGDQLSGNALKTAAELKEMKIPVIAAGFGSPEVAAPVPGENGGVTHSASGEIAGTKLDEKLLQQLAAETGGIYVRSTVTDTGFAAIQSFISRLVPENTDGNMRSNPDDLFPFFIGAALLLLVISGAISERRRTALLLLTVLSLSTGVSLYGSETSAGSDELYRQALELQRAGDKQALDLYGTLISGKDTPGILRGRALQNMGVYHHENGRSELLKSQQLLQQQNPDAALKELENVLQKFSRSEELYTQSLNFSEKAGADQDRTGNFQQLLLDRREAEKLKKAIEELKKQQQQAQQQTQKAQKENQRAGQQSGKNSAGQPQNSEKSTAEAQKAAEKLQQQAEKMDQKQLAKDAADAQKDLKDARELQQQGKYSEAEKKLQDAAEKLRPENDPQQNKTENKPEKTEAEKSRDPQKDPAGAAGEKRSEEDKNKDSAERKLQLLEDEAKDLRDAIRRQQLLRRRPVQKDW